MPCTRFRALHRIHTSSMRGVVAILAFALPALCRSGPAPHTAALAFASPVSLSALSSLSGSSVRPRGSTVSGVRAMSANGGNLEEMVQSQISSNKVMVFSKSSCPFCLKAKKVLDATGVKYEVVELDTRADGSEIQDIMLGITGGRSVPRVFVAGKFIGGGDDVVSKGKSGELTKLFEACGAL
mmetsp:Transcript_45295/g.107631  ORF Transcript_45295/g.107631 Transcript_45295/m.107631 type:complete len:183 (+) Transcript_45295:20-568(+)